MQKEKKYKRRFLTVRATSRNFQQFVPQMICNVFAYKNNSQNFRGPQKIQHISYIKKNIER